MRQHRQLYMSVRSAHGATPVFFCGQIRLKTVLLFSFEPGLLLVIDPSERVRANLMVQRPNQTS